MPQGKTLKLEIVKGIPFTNIGEDTKVIITGEVYFSDIRRATRFFSDTQNLIKKLTLVLSMAIPSNTTVQTIAFSFDNSAQGIFGSSGVLGVLNVNHKGYAVPEVLRELAKKGIFANAAVAVRTPHSADDPDIPSTSSNAPYPEPNRVVFTLLPDGTTVEYRTRFGLASLEPKNVFTHALPESHHSDNGTEGQSNDASSEDDPIKAILQEKIAGSGSDKKEDWIKNIIEDNSIDPQLKDQLLAGIIEEYLLRDEAEDKSVDARPEGNPGRAANGDNLPGIIPDRPTGDIRKNAQEYSLYSNFQQAIFHGLLETPGTEKVTFVNPDRAEAIHLSDSLDLVMQSTSYSQWLAHYEHRFCWLGQISQLQQLMDLFQSEEEKARAFETLKRRIQARSYDIRTLDLSTPEGAATLNAEYRNDFANIRLLTEQLPGPCNRRRRSADANSCNARRK
ncbi:hypothetical protein, partial [Endozoicomonas sp. SESOKO4]|uniref:hypothetical protein n=1 Tax=Endozoicomonas sp. SESOKO4 TaxID=2828745 RepID=UPI0021489C53